MSNTNILLAGRSPDLITPAEAMQQAANANNALAQGAMRSMQAQQLGQQMRDEGQFNALMDQAGGDYNKIMQDPSVNWRVKQQVGAQLAEQDAARAKNHEAAVDAHIKELDVLGRYMSPVKDQATYDYAKSQLANVPGMSEKVAQMPKEYNADIVNSNLQMAMSHKDQLLQQREQRQAEYQNKSLDLQERRLQAAENRGNGMDAQDKGWEVKETAGGLVRVNKYTGDIAPITMGGQAVQGKPAGGGNASEDERKAAGWASQMELAKSQIGDVLAKDPSASDKGILESLAPGELLSRQAMSENRKRYVDAVSSLSEAALRAATGAGINESEARQKIAELSPVYGDTEAIIADKMARMDMYIQSVTGRAGRAQGSIVKPVSPALSGADAEAAAWAQANPNDPRAAAIRQRLGL